ncbi:cellulose synthase complex periplasmic endoglucanase BcsZ [Mesopusillimonas faecipullorum]|nr:cellulose synthase complex periplasmic endoglucanase BcsZ [Mesopusillimonas faecipullorum]
MTAALCALPLSGQSWATANTVDKACQVAVKWPQWQVFVDHFLQADGRVLDASTSKQHSSSEGQSYGMFFALVANDRQTFERMWRWTVDNLAQGDIGKHLPAWIWGRDEQGNWGVMDDNSASDAELWFIYALLEAGRRWRRDDYLRDARALLAKVEAEEVTELPGLGKMLLPGPKHFALPDNIWRLNPSYLPMPVLRRLAEESPQGPWREIAGNTVTMLKAISPFGYAADWVCYQAGEVENTGRFIVDPEKGDIGSYDAIRVYLWAGLTSAADPYARTLLQVMYGMSTAVATTGAPPEIVHTLTGQTVNTGPAGFSAALVPYLHARSEPSLMQAQYQRATALWQSGLRLSQENSQQPAYYDHVLSLFCTGWQQGHYQFQASGSLQLSWDESCPHATTR